MVAITTTPASHRNGPGLRLVRPPVVRARRRHHALVAVVLVVLALAAAVYLATSAPAVGAGSGIGLVDETHVVAEGETMWSIARQVAPAGEAATYVERLVEVNGGATVEVGQVLSLPRP